LRSYVERTGGSCSIASAASTSTSVTDWYSGYFGRTCTTAISMLCAGVRSRASAAADTLPHLSVTDLG